MILGERAKTLRAALRERGGQRSSLRKDNDDILARVASFTDVPDLRNEVVIIVCNYKESNYNRLVKQFRVVSIIPPKNT